MIGQLSRAVGDRESATARSSSADGVDERAVRGVDLVRGLVGGAIATAVMTAFRLPISRSLPPTATFWARFVGGGRPEDHRLAALALHVAYGAAAGGAYALVWRPAWDRLTVNAIREPSEWRRELLGTAAGVAYGLALSLVGERLLLEGLLGERLTTDERLVFHLGHVVYGLTLGTWLGSRTQADDGATAE